MRRTNVGRSARGITAHRAVVVVALCVGLVVPMTGTAHAVDYSLSVEKTGSGVGTVFSTPQFTTFRDPGIDNAFSITTGPDGEQWFLNTAPGASSVGQITSEGVVTTFPIAAMGARSFYPDPSTITLGPDNNLWFTDYSNNSINRMTTAGVLDSFDSLTLGPGGITSGPDGNLWFTSHYLNEIGRISQDGQNVQTFASPGFERPTAITAGHDGNVWFTGHDAGGVGVMDTDGLMVDSFSDERVPNPTAIIAGQYGAMSFGGAFAMGKVDAQGELTVNQDYTAMHYVAGLANGYDAALWFSNDDGSVGRILGGVATGYDDSDESTNQLWGISQGATDLWAAGGTDDTIVRITPDYGIDCGTNCFANYAPDQTVTLRAVAEYPNRFMGWSGAACAGETSNECTVVMDAAKGVSAEFANAPTPRQCYAAGEFHNVIVGTSDDDVLVGTDGPDAICGGRGSDTIRGLGGDDLLYGNDGNDVIRGGAGVDWTRGSDGMDEISGGPGEDFTKGGPGNDTLYGDDAADQLRGNGGDDALFGNAGPDLLLGGIGDDDIDGGIGRDICYGNAGTNALVDCEPHPEE
jgi:streptogramin lyase